MNKKILMSMSVIVAAAAVIIGGTSAFFSDTETSTGNTFTAGAIDLKVDSQATYNGVTYADGTWGQTAGLDIVNEKFFNFSDVKPGDYGENTISLHVINNDAYVCATVANLASNDNGINDPESSVDTTDGVGNGELDDTLLWKVWRDDGAGSGTAGDNIQNGTEQTLVEGYPVNGTLAVYDSTTGGALAGGTTGYLGVSWSLPLETGNEVQTDSLTGDISFNVVQSRNNGDFRCVPTQGPVAPVVDGVISAGEYDGALSMPITNANGGTVKAKTQGGFLYLAADIPTDLTDNRGVPGFNDEFGVNLGESPATDTIVRALGSTNANGRTFGPTDGLWSNFDPTGYEIKSLFGTGHRVLEFKIPLSAVSGVVNGDTLSIGGATESTDGNSAVYPTGLAWGNNSTYGQLLVQ